MRIADPHWPKVVAMFTLTDDARRLMCLERTLHYDHSVIPGAEAV